MRFLYLFGSLKNSTYARAVAQDEHLGVQFVAHGAAQHCEELLFATGFGACHPRRGDLKDAQMPARFRLAGGAVSVAAALSAQSLRVFEPKGETSVGICDLPPVELDEQPLGAHERCAVEPLVFPAGAATRRCGQQAEQTDETDELTVLHTKKTDEFFVFG